MDRDMVPKRIIYQLTTEQRAIYTRFASLALPRHTSYPIASVWNPNYGAADFQVDLWQLARDEPVSLYVHIPFCERLCYYCACTKEIVPPEKHHGRDPAVDFLRGLEMEAAFVATAAGPRTIKQLHLGGGSPTFLTPEQLERLWQILTRQFSPAPDAEIAVEIDPRHADTDRLQTLRRLGFNRVSLGIQDFDPKVQSIVNRVQPYELVARVVQECRALGFGSINFDLIYGLPLQTPATMMETLDKTVALGPDRIAFYRLAVIPEMFRWQNTFRQADLPSGERALDLNLLAINRFQEAGYEFIGLDHFARPSEGLAMAALAGTMHRSFQGMTTGKGLDILGLGPSAISQLDWAFAQNRKTSAEWRQSVANGLATERGLHLNRDDRIRRELMHQLYGHGKIVKQSLEQRFGIVFDKYFSSEMQRMEDLQDHGLVDIDAESLRLTVPLGRLLVRVAAAVFDHYLPHNAYRDGLSPTLASRVG
jgi:oxygen-independent coproporphyrinogen III oxidase